MPTTSLAALGLNWSQLTEVSAPAKSANPVLKLKFSTGAVYWLKAAPGGARIAFAEKTMNRVGFKSLGSELLQPSELEALAQSPKAGVADVTALLTKMRQRLATGQDLILSAHVGGNGTYESKVFGDFDFANGTNDEFRATGHNHALLMQSANAQRDLARMIAVDLLLGNFDRVAKGGSGGRAHFHLGNFIYDAASEGFLPIDNDTLAPSMQHMDRVYYKDDTGKKKSRKPTKMDLYRTAILGGSLLDNEDLYATPDQADLSSMLGSDAQDTIYEIISGKWGSMKLLDQGDADVLKQVAAAIVPLVREEMRSLIKELKTSSSTKGDEGLLKTLKACENVEGMNYSVFKVRSRFAELMTLGDAPPSTDDSMQHALSYSMYRDWKEDFQKLVAQPVPDYPVPDVQVVMHTSGDKAKRGLNTLFGKVGLLQLDKKEVKAKEIAKSFKTKVRNKKVALDYQALKTEYEAGLKNAADSDNRIIKAKLLVIGVLVNAELAQLRTMFDELVTAHTHQKVVATLYAKAFMKHDNDAKLQTLLGAYELIIARLKRQLNSPDKILKSDDTAMIGVGGGQTALEDLCRDCRSKYSVLKTMAVG